MQPRHSPISILLTGCRHSCGALFQLLHRDVLNVGCNMPDMPKGVFERTAAVAVELICHRSQRFSTGRQRFFYNLVHVLDVEMNVDRSASDRMRTAEVHFRKFICQHDTGVAISISAWPMVPRGPGIRMTSLAP